MMFKRAVSFGPAVRPRSHPRRGTFALEPVEALPRLSERIAHLAKRSLEANPFFLPEFLEPAIHALGSRNLRLAVFSDREDIRFFAPVLVTSGRFFRGRAFRVWTHPYAPLGTPLIDRDMVPLVTDSLIRHMRTSGRTLLLIPDFPLQGPTSEALRMAAARRGFWTEAGRQMRPILHPRSAGGLAGFDRMVSAKRRRELDRQLRRLCDTGSVSFMSAHTPTEIEAAFNMFTALEASGWKGRGGSALLRRGRVHEFARIAVMQLAQNGHSTIDVMRVGDRPIAALIRFEQQGLSIPWKIAFDEGFAVFSPGKQLMCDETRRWLLDPEIERVDPVCEEDNPLMAPLWPEREPHGTLLLSSRRFGLGARVRARLIDVKRAAARRARRFLGAGWRSRSPVSRRPRKPRTRAEERPGSTRRRSRRTGLPSGAG